MVDMGQPGAFFEFLGYRFKRALVSGKLHRFIRTKSLKRIKDRIKPLTKRANGHSLPCIITKLKPILRGVSEYFQHAYHGQLKELDGWVRGRLRSILRKRRKGKGRGRGRDHHRWPNHYFEQLGLFSLEQAQKQALINLREGVNC